MRISSAQGTALGGAALHAAPPVADIAAAFGAPQEPDAGFDPFDSPTVSMPIQGPPSGVSARRSARPEPSSEGDPTPLTTPAPPPEHESDVSVPLAANEPVTTALVAPPPDETDEPPEPEEPDLSGRTIASRYRLVQRLGEGGMGVVYQAVDERLEKNVAVKVLKADFARRTDVVARFTQEAKSAARIKHENVLDVTDYGRTEDGSFYIAMELLVGTDLADLLTREGHLAPDRALDVAIQVCRALSAAHREGVVHRDLKPENVFLLRNGDGREVVKIVDFGIAHMKDLSGSGESSRKLTRTGMIFGTPEYMSPEQAAGKPIDHRVDVYATGVILYEMFAGRVPFTGDSFMGVLMQHMNAQPPPVLHVNPNSRVTPDLEAVIFKALAKEPAQRYASMAELGEDIARVRAGAKPTAPSVAEPSAVAVAPVHGEPAPTAGVARTIENELPARGRRGLIFGGIALAAAAVVAVAFVSLTGDPPPAPPVAPASPRVAPRTAHAATQPATPTPAAAVDAGVVPVVPTTVELEINTSVEGARVSVEPTNGGPGFSCDAPCTHTVTVGEALRLSAVRGNRRGAMELTPAAGQEPVRIEMSAPSSRPRPQPRGESNGGTGHGGRSRPCGQPDPETGLLIPCF